MSGQEPLHRRNINSLNDSELSDLRTAFKRLMDLPNDDNRSFFKHAGIHDWPEGKCWHGPRNMDGWPAIQLFLPWHRAYLYELEKDLQAQVPGVTIPYWDWTTDDGEVEKIPEAFAVETVNGEENPLYKYHVNDPSSGVVGDTFRQFDEDPIAYPNLPRPEQVENVKQQNVFEVFSSELRNIHNEVHVWVGGVMATPRYASFDPIFWAHHCMVDKIWWDWQQSNVIENIPNHYRNFALSPFNTNVENILDTFKLGYDYSEDSKEIVGGWQ